MTFWKDSKVWGSFPMSYCWFPISDYVQRNEVEILATHQAANCSTDLWCDVISEAGMQNMLFCNIDAVKPVCRERGASSEGLLPENMPIKSQCLLLKLFISSPLKKEQD